MAPKLTNLVGVPLDSAGYLNGLELMPDELRAAGLARRLSLRDDGNWDVIITDRTRDPGTGWIAFKQVQKASQLIKQEVSLALSRGDKPLLVGGDCTILLGVAAALRETYGSVGLAFLDGHIDFYDGQTSPTGEGADMELATLVGLGPPELVGLAGGTSLVDDKAVVAIGPRDEQDALSKGAVNPRVHRPDMLIYDVNAVKHVGPARLAWEVSRRFEESYHRFWLHLDLDIISGELLPAVDYPMAGGLTWEETAALLKPFAASPALLGVDVTIYNPKLDRDGRYAHTIVEMLGEVFGS